MTETSRPPDPDPFPTVDAGHHPLWPAFLAWCDECGRPDRPPALWPAYIAGYEQGRRDAAEGVKS